MHRRPTHRPHAAGLAGLALVAFLAAGAEALASDRPTDPRWVALQERSRDALAAMRGPDADGPGDAALGSVGPGMIIVGFNGGREGPDSNVSGLVRLRREIEVSMAGNHNIAALTFNNRDWEGAANDVATRVASDVSSGAPGGPAPIIVVFGHSWGGGAVTQFARRLGERGVDVALAVYVDAFSLRNPRVPANVRYAVNLYQRSGVFRGFPLRGKSRLVLDDPDSTTVLANLQIRPETDRYFGWHWNLVQPLLYRHHHRMGHDVRLHHYVISLIDIVHGSNQTAPIAPAGCELDDRCQMAEPETTRATAVGDLR